MNTDIFYNGMNKRVTLGIMSQRIFGQKLGFLFDGDEKLEINR